MTNLRLELPRRRHAAKHGIGPLHALSRVNRVWCKLPEGFEAGDSVRRWVEA
jgi:hypothetical protein